MQEQENERPLFASLRYDVIKKLKISWAEYVLLDMIYHLSAKHGYCYKTMTSIANDLDITFTGAKKMVKRLTERELLIKHNGGLVCGSAYIDCAYLEKRVITSKTELSSERKQTDRTKFREAKIEKYDETTETELSSTNRNLVQKTELSSDKNNNKKDNIKKLDKSNLANGYGKPEINEAFDYWEKTTGLRIQAKLQQNRNAASNLIKRYGAEKLHQLIDGVALAQSDQYAPRISDFTGLQAKLNDLLVWGRQQTQTRKGQVYAI